MVVAEQESNGPGRGDAVGKRPGRSRWQVGLRTLFLLIAAIAVWITFFINRQHNAMLESRLPALRSLARELVIEDPSKIAVVQKEQLWNDDYRWEIYLPHDGYRLCVATREIEGWGGFPTISRSEPLPAGRQHLAMEQRKGNGEWRVIITRNGIPVLEVEEPEGWDPGSGWVGGGPSETSTQFPPDEPLTLFRRRFTQRDEQGRSITPDGPAEGILFWIEPVVESAPAG